MAAPIGNQFWKLADPTKLGSEKAFTPEKLWGEASAYFTEMDETSWEKRVLPYTIAGLCIYLGIDENTIQRYHTADGYEGHWAVTEHIYQIIYNQKFTGASVGLFNSNIIARDLGLVDKKEEHHKGAIAVSEMTVEQIDESLVKLVAKALANG